MTVYDEGEAWLAKAGRPIPPPLPMEPLIKWPEPLGFWRRLFGMEGARLKGRQNHTTQLQGVK